MTAKTDQINSHLSSTRYVKNNEGQILTSQGPRTISIICSKSKCGMLALFVGVAAGAILIGFSASHYFGAYGSVGFIISSSTGAMLALASILAIMILAFKYCKNKPATPPSIKDSPKGPTAPNAPLESKPVSKPQNLPAPIRDTLKTKEEEKIEASFHATKVEKPFNTQQKDKEVRYFKRMVAEASKIWSEAPSELQSRIQTAFNKLKENVLPQLPLHLSSEEKELLFKSGFIVQSQAQPILKNTHSSDTLTMLFGEGLGKVAMQTQAISHLIYRYSDNSFALTNIINFLRENKERDLLDALFKFHDIGNYFLNVFKQEPQYPQNLAHFCFTFAIFPCHLFEDEEVKFLINNMFSFSSKLVDPQEVRSRFLSSLLGFKSRDYLTEAFKQLLNNEKDPEVIIDCLIEIMRILSLDLAKKGNTPEFPDKLEQEFGYVYFLLGCSHDSLHESAKLNSVLETKISNFINSGKYQNAHACLLLESLSYATFKLWKTDDEEKSKNNFKLFITTLPILIMENLKSFIPESEYQEAYKILKEKEMIE